MRLMGAWWSWKLTCAVPPHSGMYTLSVAGLYPVAVTDTMLMLLASKGTVEMEYVPVMLVVVVMVPLLFVT